MKNQNLYTALVKPEIDYIIANANFDERELLVFNARSKNIPLESIAEQMNCSVSTINRINRTLTTKLLKVLKTMEEN